MELKKRVMQKSLFHFTKVSFFFLFLVFFTLINSEEAFATKPVRVAFFISYDSNDEIIELIPGGRFYHVAIQIEGDWYHASPTNGVEKIDNLIHLSEEHLYVVDVFESKVHDHLTINDMTPYLGQPFDYMYEWESEDKTDCTKFIAKLLGVSPTKTEFIGNHWSVSYGIKPGGLGLSPDELRLNLHKIGFYSLQNPAEFMESSESVEASALHVELGCQSLLIK